MVKTIGADHARQAAGFGRLRPFWPLALIGLVAAVALFPNLGRDSLWEDEGDTAVLAANVLKYGLPRAWDGTTFIAPDGGERLNADLVMVSHPWAQYYVAAASFALFGPTAFAARLPFAIAGLAAMALLYLCVLRASGRHGAAAIAAVLTLSSVQFLLYARQARYYSLSMALVCAMVLIFRRLTSRRAAFAFAGVTIVAFHTNPTVLAPWLALGVLTIAAPSCRPFRRHYWQTVPVVALFTVPWMFVAASGYGANTFPLTNVAELGPRLTQFLIEWVSMTPVLAVAACGLALRLADRHRVVRVAGAAGRQGRSHARSIAATGGWSEDERRYFIIFTAIAFAYGATLIVAESVDNMFVAGLRYAAPLIPLTIGAAALCIARLGRGRPALAVALVGVLAATNLGRLTPVASFLTRADDDAPGTASVHVADGWKASLLRTSLVSYTRELLHDNPGTVTAIAAFLRAHASATDVVVTNYEWEPLYFDTGLPQGLKIAPRSPVYVAAKQHGLPDFVFSVEHARWVVWRWAWNGYKGDDWTMMTTRFANAGARLVKVAEVPETIWENRENIYFHRFATSTYLYRQEPGTDRAAEIYRVEWPG